MNEALHNREVTAEPEAAGRIALDTYLEMLRSVAERPVRTPNAQASADRLRGRLGDEGVGMEAAFREFAADIIPGSLNMPHPLYLGLLNCSPLPAAPLADLLVSALNNNNGAPHQGPAAAVAETELLAALSRLCFGHDRASGMILPGGSFANLQGLMLARARHFPEWETGGPAALSGRPVVYVGASSHFSASRAGRIVGVGRNGVTVVPATGRGAMDVDALERLVARDLAEGATPFAVVATAGTTGTGAIDPIVTIADLCKRHDLWLHVDACYGGAACMLSEMRDRFAGIERADSVALDPHKWFFVPLTTSVLLVPDRELELATFEEPVSYIPSQSSDDGYRRGMATSRRASGLTLWTAVRAHGWNAIRDAVRRNIALTRTLETDLREAGFEVLPGGELSIACARWAPPGGCPEAVDLLQVRIRDAVVATGDAWFATTRHDDKTWLCFRITNLYTTRQDVTALVEMIREVVARLPHEPGEAVEPEAG